ncbi:MAG: hypothetical protein ACYC27_14115 [Armatimonadota bacterium]
MRRTSILLFVVSIIAVSAGMCSEPIDLPMIPMPQPVSVPLKSTTVLFEESLNTLIRNNQLPKSIVAVIDPEPQQRNPNQPQNAAQPQTAENPQYDPSRCGSLDELGRVFGLRVFEDKGLYVLAPPATLNLQAMISGQWINREYSVQDDAYNSLVTSFTPDQLAALGSSAGIGIQKLNAEQRSMLGVILHPSANIIHTRITESDIGPPMFVSDISLSGITIGCRLDIYGINLKSADIEYPGYINIYDYKLENFTDRYIGEWRLLEYQYDADPPPMMPNSLKASELDYNRSELKTVLDIDGTITLRDLILLAAKDSGLNLVPCLGAEKVKLYIRSGQRSAGSILKAAALAVQSSWRNCGNGYLLTADPIGVSQAFIKVQEKTVKRDIVYYDTTEGQLNPDWIRSVFRLLPNNMDDFTLTPEQIQAVSKWNGDGPGPLTVDMLTSQQKLFIEQRIQKRIEEVKKSGAQDVSYPPFTHICPLVQVRMAFNIPKLGIVDTDEFLQLIRPNEIGERLNSQTPPDVSFTIDKPVRGLMLKPQKDDTPESIIRIMTDHGFNALYLRVFSDGYTIFPSSEFPSRKWVSDSDYLKKIISDAHGKGIKVYAVADVLRWSDGDKGHWVRKRPELLDYDMLGRTQSEWASLGIKSNKKARVEQFLMGDARTGDVVTPLSPVVKDKLRILISELSGYQFDGLALDHTAIQHTNMGMIVENEIGLNFSYSDLIMPSGQPGFNRVSRAAFIASHGLDPIDIPWDDTAPSSYVPNETTTPVMQVMEIAARDEKIQNDWSNYYFKSCDNLLDSIVSQWQQKKKDVPIWVVDTYSEDLNLTHDWRRFAGRITGTLNTLALDMSTYPGNVMKRIGLLRAADSIGSLMFTSMLARMDGKSFPGMLGPMEPGKILHAGQGIVIDLACSEKNRREFLRVIKPAGSIPEK